MSIVFSHYAGLQDKIMLYEVMHCKGKVKSKTKKTNNNKKNQIKELLS